MDTTPDQVPAFGDVLRRYRRLTGLTQEALAERAHVSARAIAALERGINRAPRKDTLRLLADALGLAGPARAAFEAAARPPRTGPSTGADQNRPETARRPSPLAAMPPPLVGRTDELTLLERHLAGETAPVLLLAGEPGIGKSRLLHEVAERAPGHGWTVLHGGCQRRGGQEPYSPLLEALERHVRHQPPARLRVELRGCAWLVRLLPELAAGPIEPLPDWTVPPEQERRLMFRAVERFLANMAGPAGTLLLLDDLHWAGADALDLLATLVHPGGAPLRVVGAYRDTDVAPRDPLAMLLADLARAGLTTQRALAPLAPHEVAQLLSHLLAGGADQQDEAQAALRERVLQRAGGVPFFVVSCAQVLREDIRVGGSGDAVPWDLAQSLRQRVAALPEGAREVLGAAAVIGRRVPPTLLMAVAGRPEQDVLAALDSACRARLLVEDGPAYHFAHDVIREVIEADAGAARRMVLHRRVVQALEAAEQSKPGSMIEQLAYHSRQAGEAQKALHYAQLAGDRAMRMSAYRDAVAQYEVALQLLAADDLHARAELLDRLGTAAYPLSDTTQYLPYWQEAQRLYDQIGEHCKAADLSRRLGRVYWERGETATAFAHTRAAVSALEAEPPPGHELAMAYSALSQLYMLSSRAREGVEWGEKALRLAEEFGDEGVIVHALNNIGSSLADLGESQRGIAYLERSLELAKQAGLAFDTIRAYDNLSQRLLWLGEFQQAADLVREGLGFTEQVGWVMGTGFLLGHLATVEMELGFWDRAHASIERAIAAGEMGFPIARLMAVPKKGELLLRQGRLDEAGLLLEEALPVSEEQGEFEVLGQLLPALARTRLARGEVAPAVAAMDRCIALSRDIGLLVGSESLLGDGVEVYLQTGREDAARDLLEDLATLTARVSAPLGRARLADARGLVAAHDGRHAEAAAHFERAAVLWRDMACPYEEARARRRHAESLLHGGDPAVRAAAERELAAARDIVARLGARLEEEAVAAVARRHRLAHLAP